ncbi:hypothetical protein ACSQ67_023726 [Phaseolus vulgaris]
MSTLASGSNSLCHINISVNQVGGGGGFPTKYDTDLINVVSQVGSLDSVEVMMERNMVIVHHWKDLVGKNIEGLA